jgi:hypothetical protein
MIVALTAGCRQFIMWTQKIQTPTDCRCGSSQLSSSGDNWQQACSAAVAAAAAGTAAVTAEVKAGEGSRLAASWHMAALQKQHTDEPCSEPVSTRQGTIRQARK